MKEAFPLAPSAEAARPAVVVRAWAQHPAAAALLAGAEGWFRRLLPAAVWRGSEDQEAQPEKLAPDPPAGPRRKGPRPARKGVENGV